LCIEQLRHLPPSATSPLNPADLAMARQFFDSGPRSSGFQAPIPAASYQLLESMQHVPRPADLRPHEVDPAHWEMKMPVFSVPSNSKWSDEFGSGPVGVSTARFNDATSTLNGGLSSAFTTFNQ
jgi:peroxin-5